MGKPGKARGGGRFCRTGESGSSVRSMTVLELVCRDIVAAFVAVVCGRRRGLPPGRVKAGLVDADGEGTISTSGSASPPTLSTSISIRSSSLNGSRPGSARGMVNVRFLAFVSPL